MSEIDLYENPTNIGEVEFKIVRQITDYDIECILTTCFEGGSNYWIDSINTIKEIEDVTNSSTLVALGGEIEITTEDDDKEKLDRDKLIHGLQLCIGNGHFDIDDLNDLDANDCDLILQYALFKEVTYS